MFYYYAFSTLIGLTLLISLASFFWALKSGQFEDQQRVSYLPLIDLPPAEEKARPFKRRAELYVLLGCGLLVLSAMIASVLLGLRLI